MSSALWRRFAKRARDPALRRNLLRATDTSNASRASAVAERGDWEELRVRAAALRDHALAHLDLHVARFADEVRARGGRVHSARTARDACRIITGIARRKGATRILKSKSMATEEVELNRAFERLGFAPLETDLGEYIVQIAGEAPSHITAPALHRSAEEVRDLFLAHGVVSRDDPLPAARKELARWLSLAARRHLAGRLREADLGITGANFLIAESGTVVLVENEGNIRFTTTTPRAQIVLAGVEKIVPRMEDLAVMLPLLVRSATGQRFPGYVSLISGPAVESLDIVLLDAGRTAALADPGDREILRCIRCGACLNVCPVYRTVGGHAYDSPYPGPIGALLTPLLRGRDADHALPQASTLCGACSEVCPVRIPLVDHLLRLRGRAVRAGRPGPLERMAFRLFAGVAGRPAWWARAVSLLRRLLGPLARSGLLAAWTKHREMPPRAPRTFHEIWRDDGPPAP
jgi:L-lactate dehydrogenase complex protein LldF